MQPLIIYGANSDLIRESAIQYVKKLDPCILDTSEYFFVKPLKDKKSISIEQVRNLLEQLATKPVLSKYKVVVFDSAELLTIEAQNAMLKTLEESPFYLLIIFCVRHSTQLIETVVSRCNSLSAENGLQNNNLVSQDWYCSLFELVKMTIGERVDWVFGNKVVLAQKGEVVELIDYWLTEIHAFFLDKDQAGYNYSENIANSVSELFNSKKHLSNNANPLMVIESFLYTIE